MYAAHASTPVTSSGQYSRRLAVTTAPKIARAFGRSPRKRTALASHGVICFRGYGWRKNPCRLGSLKKLMSPHAIAWRLVQTLR